MLFQQSIKKILVARGYRHCQNDDELTRHGEYARHIQYAYSKEFQESREKIVDIIFLGIDFKNEKFVIGFFRENVSVEHGVIQNSDVSIPLVKFSLEEFEKQIDRLIPSGNPFRREGSDRQAF